VKLSDLKPDEIEVIGDQSASSGRAPSAANPLRLSDIHPDEVEQADDPSSSPITAVTTGLIQGAVPFAGSLAGIGKAGMDAVTGIRGPLGGGTLQDIVDDYRQTRDSFSADAKRAADANPKVSLASNLAGGMANPLFKGADSLPKAMGASAIQAAGMSDADLTRGEIGQAASDAVAGAGAGALGYGVGQAIPKALQFGKWFGKKALTTLGPSQEAIEARLAGKALDTAKSYPQLADEMGDTLKQLGSKTSAMDQEAWNTLSQEQTIPRAYVTSPIDEAIQSLKLHGQTIGPTDKQAVNTLGSLKYDLNRLGDKLSEQDLKGIVKKLDDNINWDDQGSSKLNTLLEGLRSQFDDALKFQNPSYKKAMQPIAEQTDLLNKLRQKFNFQNEPGKGLVPTDTTASKIQNALRDNKDITGKELEKLSELTGKNYLDLANDYRLAQQFDRTNPNGSRRTLLGEVLGKAVLGGIGGLVGDQVGGEKGAAIGALTGASLDTYGGRAAAKIIDNFLKTGNSTAMGKFGPLIEKAAQKGPQALAVLSSILSKDPEFRMQIDQLIPDEIQNRTIGSTGGKK
jgi:hypothetical protein